MKKLEKVEDQYHKTFDFSEDKAILNKCCLTEEEMNKYLESTEHIDPKDEHDHLYSVMTNDTRRELLKLINTNAMTLEEIKEKVQLDKEQLQYHLSMLEQLFFLMNTSEGWKTTPRGLGFLYYTILE
ncbi:MAG: ArsR family transcriptional regulator [Promethearchaeota archaeon]|nr:MAG: ArsR family transcriptional regulator [Candidatus Lokiarchaeota archaeon]